MEEKCTFLSKADRERLLTFGDLLQEASGRKNLLSAGDRAQLYSRHLRESLDRALLDALPEEGATLDIGSGSGLPGIVLALALPRAQFVLLEPRAKRVAFLERAVLRLGLSPRVEVFAGRVEDLARQSSRVPAHAAVARALRWTPEMIDALDALLEPDGYLVRFGSPQEESPGVRVFPTAGGERAIQVWPRESWGALPNAK